MAKKTKISQEDIEAFQTAIKGTKPLVQKPRITRSTPPTKPIRKPESYKDDTIHLDDAMNEEKVAGEEFLSYKHTSISNKILRKLRKGQYNVDAILDLHGMSVHEAKDAVESFLQQCVNKGIRVALIIHGKGSHSEMPVLKNKINHWLRRVDVVLAFCSAAPTHGSRGAIYVLFKRDREENLA